MLEHKNKFLSRLCFYQGRLPLRHVDCCYFEMLVLLNIIILLIPFAHFYI